MKNQWRKLGDSEHVGAHPCPHADTYPGLVSQPPNSPLGFPVLVGGTTSQPEAGGDPGDPFPLFYTLTSGQSLKSCRSYVLNLSSPSTAPSRRCSLPTILVTSSSSSSSSFQLPPPIQLEQSQSRDSLA